VRGDASRRRFIHGVHRGARAWRRDRHESGAAMRGGTCGPPWMNREGGLGVEAGRAEWGPSCGPTVTGEDRVSQNGGSSGGLPD
jgi:hypothetical protein